MMAHKKGFVVAIRSDKKQILRENNSREVFLPFGSQYSIRLRNNHNRDAVAEIMIDGTDVLGGHQMIVPANSSVDVDRFCLDGDLSSGNKFKFVSVEDERVQDPTSVDNGDVRVKFWLEKERPVIRIDDPEVHHYYHHHHYRYTRGSRSPWDIYSYWSNDTTGTPPELNSTYWSTSGTTESSRGGDSLARETSTMSFSGEDKPRRKSMTNDSICNMFSEKGGATVEGSSSAQSFRYGGVGAIESGCTEIVICIKPSKAAVTVKKTRKVYCSGCGLKAKRTSNFCSGCGTAIEKQEMCV